MKNRTALNKMCVDISEKMCYHVSNRRSDLGVVVGNPEFGHGGCHPPCSAAALTLSGRALRIKRSRGKSCLQSFNNIQLSSFQYIACRMYFRLNLTLKAHIL